LSAEARDAKQHRSIIRNDACLIVALLISSALTSWTLTLLARSSTELQAARTLITRHQAFQAAEAGLDALIVENRAGQFLTHLSSAQDPDNPGAAVPTPPTPQIAGAGIDPAGNYVVSIGPRRASVQAWANPANGLLEVRSVGTADSINRRLTSLLTQQGFLEYMILVSGDYHMDWGQGVFINGQQGKIHIEGNLELESGNSDNPVNRLGKRWEITAGLINVNGVLHRTVDDQTNTADEAPISLRQTSMANFKIFPTPGIGQRFSSSAFDGATSSWNPTAAYTTWLAGNPLLPNGFLKEISSQAGSLASLFPSLPDIDTFVTRLGDDAPIRITGLNDADIVGTDADLVACLRTASSTPPAFANISTLQMVSAVEIDLALLESCDNRDAAKVVYASVPVRLVNGAELDAGVTVAGTHAIYVKGHFNAVDPKPSAIVTGNRVYHLSSTFRDYSRFIDPVDHAGNVYTGPAALADAINAYGSNAGAYNAYLARYNELTVAPPIASWLPSFAGDTDGDRRPDAPEATTQHMAIVSPAHAWVNDRNVLPKYGLLEDWGRTSPYNPKGGSLNENFIVKRVGSFLSLADESPGMLADGQTPEDRPARTSADRMIKRSSRFNAPILEIEYDPTLAADPPPGFSGALQLDGRRQVLWTDR